MNNKIVLMSILVILVLAACYANPISGNWYLYYSWRNCEECDGETYRTECLFAGDHFSCNDDFNGTVAFNGTIIQLNFDNGNKYGGRFQEDGTISGVMWMPEMEQIGIFWMEKK